MGSSKAPAAPKEPVNSQEIGASWDQSMANTGQVAGNTLPREAYDFFAPQLMSATPYGYDPSQYVNYANQWASQGPQMFDYANRVMQEGFDPQDAIYNREATRMQNQMRSSQGARGIQMSPHGAGLENQGMSDFNLDWRDRQLQRQALASQAASNLWGQGGSAISGAQGMASGIPRNIADYAGLLQQLGIQAYSPQMWGAQQYGNMFGMGAGAQQQAYQSKLGQHNADQAANQAMYSGIGKLVGTVATAPMTGGGSLAGNFLG